MKKNNIAIFCHDHCLSGANRSLLDYLSYESDKNVTVVIPKKNTEFQSLLNDVGATVIISNIFTIVRYLNKQSFKNRFKNLIKKTLNCIFYKKNYHNVLKHLKAKNIDLVISNSSVITVGYDVSCELKCKHIYHIREFMDLDHQIAYPKNISISKIFLNSYAVFISFSIQNHYLSKYVFKGSKVVYNSIKRNINYKKERVFMGDGKLNILMAGTIQENKGQIDAIGAIKILNSKYDNLNLYICGQGSEQHKLEKYCDKWKLKNVFFVGYVDDLTEFRREMDICLICSKMEALGRVTVESMYYQNFIIGTNSGETKYLLEDDRGLKYNVGNEIELANRIEYVMNNYELVKKYQDNAYAYANNKFNSGILHSIISVTNGGKRE